jgi:hypothetical protein
MKKTYFLVGVVTLVTLLQILNSCRHEIARDKCLTEPLILSFTSTDATVHLNNGSILATAMGGSGFKYSLDGGPAQDSGHFTGLAAQNYALKVTNSWGCEDSAIVVINSFDPCAGVTIVVSATKTDATLNSNNGSISATASGGGGGITFSLNGGAFQASGNFTGLAAGNYTVTAKNSNGCTGVTQITIGTVNPCAGITVVVSATKVDPTAGQSNGSITATATGGTGFTFSLNGGAFQASGTFTGLATGNYTVTARNSNGCTGSTTVALGAANPCAGVTITVSLTKIDPANGQTNGSITATATGGTGFTYSLNGGAFQASGTFTGLGAGTYTVTAKSSAGCLGTAQITLVGANPCNSIVIVISTTTANYTPCTTPNSGSITITATGSTGFTYNLNGGAYQASNVFTGLAAGTFTVGVKDVNGCTKTATATVGTTAKGPLFTNMRNLISTRCSGSGCHLNGQTTAGYNFDNDCSIVTFWNQINQSCVTYQLVRMPKSPQPLLTAAEKLVITNWITAGHRYTD